MRKASFYPKLALHNIKSNGRLYIPYLLTCVFTVAMFYIVLFIRFNNGLSEVIGGRYVEGYMMFGSVIIGIFSLVILFYTNSFLMKRRRRELGLYNILGMEKRHIAYVMLFETVLTGIGTIIVGILTGVVLSKLVYMLLLKLVNFPVPLGMSVSLPAIIYTCALFAVIFVLILFYNLWHIKLLNPIELLRENQVGQKEPKTKIILTLIGLVTLAGGYTLASIVKSPTDAILWFFIAVILVIIGTYCLFTAGSITLLKIMRSRKTYYYQTKHFVSVSGMLYRMKQNAVGLANICILSTMVLVTVSTTVTLYAGMSDYINSLYPYEISVRITEPKEDTLEAYCAYMQDVAAAEGYTVTGATWYESRTVPVWCDASGVTAPRNYSNINGYMFLMTQEEYSRYTGETVSLASDEILFRADGTIQYADTISLFGESFRIRQINERDELLSGGRYLTSESLIVIVPDKATMEAFNQKASTFTESYKSNLNGFIGVSIDGSAEENREFYELMCDAVYYRGSEDELAIQENRPSGDNVGYETLSVTSRQQNTDDYYAMYGAFLFLGIFLGILFLLATILIMYYKQVTEGYEDRERFAILQKVGMSTGEVKSSIRSQVLTVFFLPLTVAGVHICFAFSMIVKIIQAFGLYNVPLFMISTAATFVIFALIYMLVYTLTERVYYKIVR